MKSYDIFRRDASGPMWVDARLYVENARARIRELAAQNPGKCFFAFDAQISSVIFELTLGNNAADAMPALIEKLSEAKSDLPG